MEFNSLSAVSGAADKTAAMQYKRPSADLTEKGGAKAGQTEIEKATAIPPLTSDFLQETIDRVNERIFGINREFSYSIHEGTGQFMVKILNKDTKEVIKEIPPEKMLDMVAKMWELAGIFLDEKL